MKRRKLRVAAFAFGAVLAASTAYTAHNPSVLGVVDGVSGPAFTLTAKSGQIDTADGNQVLIWGYADGAGTVQYPGPTLIVNQGDTVTVELTNELTVPVSIVFPGQTGVSTSEVTAPTSEGLVTLEAETGGTVMYSFTASEPGTYTYYSGTDTDLQVEMGLLGALIVRPTGFDQSTNRTAYGHPDSAYDQEYLFLQAEIDLRVHRSIEQGVPLSAIDNTDYFPVHWFINGRSAPDTLFPSFANWLPTQPYGSIVLTHVAEKVLLRVIGAGRDAHPFHHHGNHARIIAKDGRLLTSGDAAVVGADTSYEIFTIDTIPGQTVDAIFTWTGEGMGWDIYGHTTNDPATLMPFEDPNDHGKPLPVLLPEKQDVGFGGFWSGSPFLGAAGSLPPGEGGLNPWSAFTFLWHSHTEKELTNNDIFPGGLLTVLFVLPPGAPFVESAPALSPGAQPIIGKAQ